MSSSAQTQTSGVILVAVKEIQKIYAQLANLQKNL